MPLFPASRCSLRNSMTMGRSSNDDVEGTAETNFILRPPSVKGVIGLAHDVGGGVYDAMSFAKRNLTSLIITLRLRVANSQCTSRNSRQHRHTRS